MPSWIWFFVIVVAVPVVFGVLADVARRWFKLRERQLDILAQQTSEQAARNSATVERLEQRVRVLERILTDRSAELAHEIERLRNEPLN